MPEAAKPSGLRPSGFAASGMITHTSLGHDQRVLTSYMCMIVYLATCNFSENELIAKFARVSTSLKLPGIQYLKFKSTGEQISPEIWQSLHCPRFSGYVYMMSFNPG